MDVGALLGSCDGDIDGGLEMVGLALGDILGVVVGRLLGGTDGMRLGGLETVGWLVGGAVGTPDGAAVGVLEGDGEGAGDSVGVAVGFAVGFAVTVGVTVGPFDGEGDGAGDSVGTAVPWSLKTGSSMVEFVEFRSCRPYWLDRSMPGVLSRRKAGISHALVLERSRSNTRNIFFRAEAIIVSNLCTGICLINNLPKNLYVKVLIFFQKMRKYRNSELRSNRQIFLVFVSW
jgi:hypothetical protein